MKQLVYIVLFSFTIPFFSQKKVDLKPMLEKQSVRIISGRQNTYYALKANDVVAYSVKDYDRLVVYTRERIDTKALGYTISYNFDNKTNKQFIVGKKRRDYRSAYLDKEISKNVTQFYKKGIDIPSQVNIVKFKLENGTYADVKVAAFKNGKKTILKPFNETVNKVTIITGKAYKYYKINSKIPTIIETDKEGELIVYTRKRIVDNSTSNNYSFNYQIEDSEIKSVRINNVKKSTHSVFRSLKVKRTPSTYNKTIIKVGDVYQKITFSANLPIDARFVFKKTTKKGGWEELESFKGKVVPLLVKNKKTVKEYTRIEKGRPFQFSVNKIEEIKIFIRGEFQYYMHANNDYEIVLRDNGKVVNTYKLSCIRSNVMQYKYNNEYIPGTLDKFIIKVPLGKHKYSISINNKGKTALIRVLKKVQPELSFYKSTN